METNGAAQIKWRPGGVISHEYESLLRPNTKNEGPCEGGSSVSQSSQYHRQALPQAPASQPSGNPLFRAQKPRP